MNVLEVIALKPQKLGSFEHYCLRHAATTKERGGAYYAMFCGKPAQVFTEQARYTDMIVSTRSFNKIFNLSDTLYLIKFILRNKIDIVHIHFYSPYSLFTLLTAMLPVKVFITFHISASPSQRGSVVNAIKMLKARILGIGIKKIFCVSNFSKNRYLENYRENPKKVTVIYNGTDLERYKPDASFYPQITKAGQLNIICVSALIPEKGIDDLLQALSLCDTATKNCMTYIIGAGSSLSELQKLATELKLTNNVEFLGLRNDIPNLLAQCDIAVIPSKWDEAFGYTVIEAMAAGLPVVATHTGAIPEIVQHNQTGILVPPNNPKEIAAALIRLCENPQLRLDMGEQGKQRVLQYFSINKIFDEQWQYYTKNTKT